MAKGVCLTTKPGHDGWHEKTEDCAFWTSGEPSLWASGAPLSAKDINTAQDRIGNAAKRKAAPVATGVLDYFPDALIAVAELSKIGNEQHNPGTPLHWDRSKSGDEADALLRHMIDRGKLDTDGVRHSAKVAWRALAMLQKEIEAEKTAKS